MGRSVKVAVIGAGVSGLRAAHELRIEGHRVTVFEKSDQIGGTWVYDPHVDSDPVSLDPTREIVHGSLYFNLRTNLPRQLMGFSDYPFSRRASGDPRTFPGHEEVLRFVSEFAAEFGLAELVRFGSEVVRVARRDEEWVVEWRTTRGTDSVSRESFGAVVLCNGNFVEPEISPVNGL